MTPYRQWLENVQRQAGVSMPVVRRLAPFTGLLLLLAAQILFWSALTAAERSVRPAGLEARPFVEFVVLDDAGAELAEGRRFRAPWRPAPNYATAISQGSARARFEIPFNVSTAEEDQALYLAVNRSIQAVKVNGEIVKPNVPLDGFTGAAGWQPAFYMLPADALNPGRNLLTAEVANEGYAHVFPEFAIAPAEQVAAAYERGVMLNVGLPTAGVGILIFAAILCLMVNWPPEDRRRMRALVVLLLIWAVRDFSLIFEPPFDMPMPVFWIVYWSLSLAIVFAVGRYALIDTRAPERWVRVLGWAWLLSVPLCLAMPLLGGRLGPDPATWARIMSQVELWLTLIVGAGAIVLFVRDWRGGRARLFERFCLMICLTALMTDAADNSFQLTAPFAPDLALTFYVAPICGLVLGLGMCAALAAHAGEARQVVQSANLVLADRLAAREAALALSHERELAVLRRQALLEERQRIVRDMHDGIGGQLVGLILQVRGRTLDPPALEKALEASVADLRLIVDSLDTAEDSLPAALRAFEHRIRPQVEAAGVELVFDMALPDDTPACEPRVALQLLRILQEAVTNALRHSGASLVRLTAAINGDDVHLTVEDDGKGLPVDIGGGRGLASIRARAVAVGGALDITPRPGGGVRVSVHAPLLRPDSTA